MLRDVQKRFATSLMTGDINAAAIIHGGKLSGARRIEVYRHNVFSNLRATLGDIFPVVKRIVGEAFFLHAADQFIRAIPSLSGDLNQFGSAWPAFLGDYPHAAELPYLADVARLEWAWHECFHAAEASPLELGRVAAVPLEAHEALMFQLHPAVRLLTSVFPILRIWQVNQESYTGEMQVDWTLDREFLLVRRNQALGVEVLIQSCAPGAHRFLSELQQQQDLVTAASAAIEADATFNMQGFLLEFVQCGVIVDFSTERQ